MKKIFNILALAAVSLSMTACFDLTEQSFNRIEKDNFYENEGSVKGAVASVYNRATVGFSEYFFYLNEFSADQIAWRVWNGGVWGYDEAEKFVLSTHTWTSESKIINSAWDNTWQCIGQANNIIYDLQSMDPASIGMTAEDFAAYIAEMRTLRAWCYYNLFEVWGGALPLCATVTSDIPPSAGETFEEGCKNIYNFIKTELEESLPDLKNNGYARMNPATNRMILARLYLNAKVFIGEDHFADCAEICEKFIGPADKRDDRFSEYVIADDFRNIFDRNNNTCKEIIFAFAIEQGMSAGSGPLNMRNATGFAYNAWDAFGHTTNASGWNCVCVVPSHDNSGNVLATGGTDTGGKSFVYDYGDKLGAVYDRLNPKDIRRQAFYCDTDGNWNGGLFLIGKQVNYRTGEPLVADADRDGQDLVYVDQLGTFLNKGKDLAVVMSPRWGETNSGYRLVKYPVYPDECEWDYRNSEEVEFRLAEIYYMYAECKLRAGDSKAAKELVNKVRHRYYSAADWSTVQDQPGPGFSDFDLDWMLSEWGLEFLGEGRRRRTDLRRFDKFTQGQWWFFGRTDEGYEAKRDRMYEWYPLPQRALAVNPGLKQNPDYVAK